MAKILLTFELGFCKPGIKKITKENDPDFVLWSIQLFLLTCHVWVGSARTKLLSSMTNLARNPQWLIENSAAVLEAAEKARTDANQRMESLFLSYQKEAERANETARQLTIENHNLRHAIKVLRQMDDICTCNKAKNEDDQNEQT